MMAREFVVFIVCACPLSKCRVAVLRTALRSARRGSGAITASISVTPQGPSAATPIVLPTWSKRFHMNPCSTPARPQLRAGGSISRHLFRRLPADALRFLIFQVPCLGDGLSPGALRVRAPPARAPESENRGSIHRSTCDGRARNWRRARVDGSGMTAPRQILPGQLYLVTRRCTQRQLLLRPDETTTQIFLYTLG
ncbi:MAG: hypothetical protein IT577_16655, partial [Verrucomicrobiae bacterium]|nr:hypothetical protein [Verrucomicrobiae bacterium]